MNKDTMFKIINRIVPDDRGCKNWPLYKSEEGYGIVTMFTLKWKAHRLYYMLYYNKELPEHIFVIHSCDNPACVSIDHLREGTPQDNMNDKMSRKRYHNWVYKGEIAPAAILTDSQVEAIRSKYSTGEFTQKELARMYGVGQPHISDLVNGFRRTKGTGKTHTYK